jgi:hypothetical protein
VDKLRGVRAKLAYSDVAAVRAEGVNQAAYVFDASRGGDLARQGLHGVGSEVDGFVEVGLGLPDVGRLLAARCGELPRACAHRPVGGVRPVGVRGHGSSLRA